MQLFDRAIYYYRYCLCCELSTRILLDGGVYILSTVITVIIIIIMSHRIRSLDDRSRARSEKGARQ